MLDIPNPFPFQTDTNLSVAMYKLLHKAYPMSERMV